MHPLLSHLSSHLRHKPASARGFLLPRAPLLLVSIATVSACITPPPPGSAQAGSATAEDPVKARVAALELVPVPVDAPIVWDGANISLMNIDPPGSWYAFADTTGGKMVPPSVGEFEKYIIDGAIHTEGKGYTEWGGGIGMNFVGSALLTPIDASKFKGIQFKASGEGYVHVGLGVVASMPEFEICTTCYDHFAVDVKLTAEAKVYKYTWAELKQAGWGAPRTSLDPATIVALTFTSRGATQWNFNIDDVGFIE